MPSIQSSPRRAFSISVVPDRSEVAVVPDGELDLASASALTDAVRELRDAGFDRIVIDLREIEFIDSTGLGVLLSLRNDAKRDGHALMLVPGPRAVQRIFDLTATRGLFDWRA